jgi:hypothetical protein
MGVYQNIADLLGPELLPTAWKSEGTRQTRAPGPFTVATVDRQLDARRADCTDHPSALSSLYDLWTREEPHLALLKARGFSDCLQGSQVRRPQRGQQGAPSRPRRA